MDKLLFCEMLDSVQIDLFSLELINSIVHWHWTEEKPTLVLLNQMESLVKMGEE